MPIKPKDLKEHASQGKPEKRKLSISLDESIQQFLDAHKRDHEEMDKLPRKFTRNDGVHEVHPDKKDKDVGG